MDIYLTNLKTGDRLQFPMLPSEVTMKIQNQMATYSILRIGEVKIPSGAAVQNFTWNGRLPGQLRQSDPYIRAWMEPKAVCSWLDGLVVQNDKPVKARLLITETPINCDVYLSSFNATPTGGHGDMNYSIQLIQAKEIYIRKSGQATEQTQTKAQSQQNSTPPAENPPRPEQPQPRTYTVVKGDCLWKIAQKFYGDGTQYTKIRSANSSVCGHKSGNPDMIWPGDVLTIP